MKTFLLNLLLLSSHLVYVVCLQNVNQLSTLTCLCTTVSFDLILLDEENPAKDVKSSPGNSKICCKLWNDTLYQLYTVLRIVSDCN